MRTLMALLLLASWPALAATYRVDNVAGDDAADGTSQPFKTIARALRALRTSDTLVLTNTGQPYRESLPLMVGGTREQPLTIEGNGATLCGADAAPATGWQEAGGIYRLPQAVEVKFLLGPECFYETGKTPADLQPEQWFWQGGQLYFRPAAGKTPADYRLDMSVRVSGVLTNGAGQILVRNLTCERFYNDGFNIHGDSGPLWFENIRGVWNGDEGFSAHETAECHVRGGEFSHNYWHGIADVGVSRTHYQNLVVRHNRSRGLLFLGALHTVTDAEISGSPINVAVCPADVKQYPRLEAYPLRHGLTHLRSVRIQAAANEVGLQVTDRGTAVAEHCLMEGGRLNVEVLSEGRAYVTNSILTGAGEAAVSAAKTWVGDYNLYHPGRWLFAGQTYGPEQLAAFQQATGGDAHSLVDEPRFIAGTPWVSVASKAAGAAYDLYGTGVRDMGLAMRGARPVEKDQLPPGATRLPNGRASITYDFEQSHPWNLIYPEPDKSIAGVAVQRTADLSPDQAHGGRQAGRWQAVVPPGPPAHFTLKLFTVKLPYRQPVAALRFWLCGDGSGRRFQPRLRDASGECFYGAPASMDFTGWREVVWDLAQIPPNIKGGDGNQRQDGPPLELVLDVSAAAGSTVTLYVDDLTVELSD